MTELVKVKFECDLCDGCGWYEGGTSLKTWCTKCEGKGFVMVDEEKEVKHKWQHGEFKKEELGERYLTKHDTCILCGCRKTSIRFKKFGKVITCVTSYERSKQIYGHEHPPKCWGSKNP